MTLHSQEDLSAYPLVFQQAVDKVRQRRSRGAQRLNVRPRVRVASSLTAALLDGLFEQPTRQLLRGGSGRFLARGIVLAQR